MSIIEGATEMNINREKLREQAQDLLSGHSGETPEAIAMNRVAGAVLMHALLMNEISLPVTVRATPLPGAKTGKGGGAPGTVA